MHQHQSSPSNQSLPSKTLDPLRLAIKQGACFALIVLIGLLFTDTGLFPRIPLLLLLPAIAFMFSANLLFFIHAARVPGGIEYRFNIRFGDNPKTAESEEEPDATAQPFLSRFHYEASESFSIGKRR